MSSRSGSWEHIWSERKTEGFLYRTGRLIAARCDLQYIVLNELRNQCKLENSPSVLEVGCGTAPVMEMLAEYTDRRFGVDVSLSSAMLSSKFCSVATCEGRQLPFRAGSFDIVFSTGVLDLYCVAEAEEFLREIVRVLKPGGRAVVITAWRGCRLHRAVKGYLMKRSRWRYGNKNGFQSLACAVPSDSILVAEYRRGWVFQLRFISYLFENRIFFRRLYHGFFLFVSLLLRPFNRLPGALLVTVVEKK